MWVSGVVEYMSDSCTDGVSILRVSVGWLCSGVHFRLLVLVVLSY